MTTASPTHSTLSFSSTNTTAFARHDKDKTRRELLFLGNLRRTISVCLPELHRGCPVESTGRGAQWRTVRVRPEIIAAIEALQ